MNHAIVTDEDLAQARRDPVFRRQLIASHLDHLLAAIGRLRACEDSDDPVRAQQLREGARRVLELAALLQRPSSVSRPPKDAG